MFSRAASKSADPGQLAAAREARRRATPSSDTLKHLDVRMQAAQLIHRGLRLGALRSLFGELSTEALSRLFREVRGVAGRPGRLPSSFESQVRSPADAAAGVVLLADYLMLAGIGEQGKIDKIDPATMTATWDRFSGLVGSLHFPGNDVTLDITALWLLLRDYRAGRVTLCACAGCNRRRLRFADSPRQERLCPDCADR